MTHKSTSGRHEEDSPDPPPIDTDGRVRVMIDRVIPAAGGDAFPVKRALGEPLGVEAWILADGHDTLEARLRYRRRGESAWRESPFRLRYNDEWEAAFVPGEIGFWEYDVIAWIDAFQSWRTGFRKKAEAGQDPDVELEIAASLVSEAAGRTGGADAEQLRAWSDELRNHELPAGVRVERALSEALNAAMLRSADRRFAASLPRPYLLLVERERAAFSAWYEFFPRSRGERPGEHGTFRSAGRILPQIAEMGFDVVYLPPIHPIGRTKRKGANNALTARDGDVGSPWAIGSDAGGHKSVHPALGTIEDFRGFVRRAEELGMEVALDIAFQCSPDHPYVQSHPEWFKWRPDGTVQYAENPPKKYEDILPFNFETETWGELWRELRDIFFFWIEQGVRIFRVDNPHTKPLAFWHWCLASIKERHPDVILLAEAFTRPKIKYWLGRAGFTHGYTYFAWRNTKEELTAYLEELTQTEVREYFWPNFWPNTPDILHEYLVRGGRPAHAVRLVLAATLSANYGIYGPAFELAITDPFPGKEEYNHNEKYEIKEWDWEAADNLKPLIRRVNRIRRENPALRRTANIRFAPTDNPHLLAYLKRDPDDANVVLCVVNLDPQNAQMGWVDLPLDDLRIPGSHPYRVQDMLPEPGPQGGLPEYTWNGARNFIKLDPAQAPAHIFRVVPAP